MHQVSCVLCSLYPIFKPPCANLPAARAQEHLLGGASEEHLALSCLRLLARLPAKGDLLGECTASIAGARRRLLVSELAQPAGLASGSLRC